MKETFVEKRFSATNKNLLLKAIDIIEEYVADGYDLSLRQLYYQMVARAIIENTIQSYKRIGTLINNARLAGLVDWSVIEDRGRETRKLNNWNDPAEIMHDAARWFRIDKWRDQSWHVEVMVEKDALSGVLLPVCQELDICFTANKGYSSSSQMYRTAKRIQTMIDDEDKQVLLLYLGDHDPSGIDMTRDVKERLELFSWNDIELERLALNIDQVEVWEPPENPTKLTDSRAKGYIVVFGDSSWELDAVEPRTLVNLVESAVLGVRNDQLWGEALAHEKQMKADLLGYARRYNGHNSD